MVRFRGRAFFVTIFFLFAAPQIATADDARAKAHFQNAVHLYDQQPPDYEGALAEFRAAEKEKNSPGIKRNIALCLRALHRYGEAIDELDAMLQAGDNLKPETREAGKKILAELNALVGTVRIKVVLHKNSEKQAPIEIVPRVDVTMDGAPIPAGKLGVPFNVGPGDHLFVARADGFGDATKKVSVVAGEHDVPVDLDLLPAVTGVQLGTLRVHANVERASIFIDGVAIANGTWEGGLPAGRHHVEARADGLPTWSQDVDVTPGARVELNATLGDSSVPPPPPYEPGKPANREKQPNRPWYVEGGFGVFTGARTFNPVAFPNTDPVPTDRGLNGASLLLKGGRHVGKFVSLEGWAELGAMKPVNNNFDVTVGYFQIGPELRVHSKGDVRFIAGTGLGLELDAVTVTSLKSDATKASKGGGVEGAWLLEVGTQFYFLERYFFETSLYLDVSGDGSLTGSIPTLAGGQTTTTNERYFLSSPSTRGGLRVLFGFDL